MKKITLVITALLLGSLPAFAQYKLYDGKLWFTASERLRTEYRANNFTFPGGTNHAFFRDLYSN